MKAKKMIAPILITVIMIIYYIVYFFFLMTMLDGILKFLFGVIPLLFTVVTIKACIERIHEIRKGEEDDLSQY